MPGQSPNSIYYIHPTFPLLVTLGRFLWIYIGNNMESDYYTGFSILGLTFYAIGLISHLYQY